jgi:hypothetical protein
VPGRVRSAVASPGRAAEPGRMLGADGAWRAGERGGIKPGNFRIREMISITRIIMITNIFFTMKISCSHSTKNLLDMFLGL